MSDGSPSNEGHNFSNVNGSIQVLLLPQRNMKITDERLTSESIGLSEEGSQFEPRFAATVKSPPSREELRIVNYPQQFGSRRGHHGQVHRSIGSDEFMTVQDSLQPFREHPLLQDLEVRKPGSPLSPSALASSMEQLPRKIDKIHLYEQVSNRFYQSMSKLKSQENRLKQLQADSTRSALGRNTSSRQLVRTPSKAIVDAETQDIGMVRDESRGEFRRFNENLELIVPYRSKDTKQYKDIFKQTTSNHFKREPSIPQGFKEVSKMVEQSASRGGANPIQQSLLLLSKSSLNMTMTDEQHKQVNHTERSSTLSHSASRLQISSSRVKLNSTVKVSPQKERIYEKNGHKGADLKPYKQGRAISPKAQTKYSVEGPNDPLLKLFNIQKKQSQNQLNIKNLQAESKQQQKLAKIGVSRTGIQTKKDSPLKSERKPIFLSQNLRLMQRTARGPVFPQKTPKSIPLTSQNPSLYLGKNPKYANATNSSGGVDKFQTSLASPGRLMDIHIIRGANIQLMTYKQISSQTRAKVEIPSPPQAASTLETMSAENRSSRKNMGLKRRPTISEIESTNSFSQSGKGGDRFIAPIRIQNRYSKYQR